MPTWTLPRHAVESNNPQKQNAPAKSLRPFIANATIPCNQTGPRNSEKIKSRCAEKETERAVPQELNRSGRHRYACLQLLGRQPWKTLTFCQVRPEATIEGREDGQPRPGFGSSRRALNKHPATVSLPRWAKPCKGAAETPPFSPRTPARVREDEFCRLSPSAFARPPTHRLPRPPPTFIEFLRRGLPILPSLGG